MNGHLQTSATLLLVSTEQTAGRVLELRFLIILELEWAKQALIEIHFIEQEHSTLI